MRLFERRAYALTASYLLFYPRIREATKARKNFKLEELCIVEAQASSCLALGLGLRFTAHATDAQPNIDGGLAAFMEQLCV